MIAPPLAAKVCAGLERKERQLAGRYVLARPDRGQPGLGVQ